MSANEEQLRNLIAQQAADWFVANREALSTREREDFTAWLKTSPLHVEEYLGLSVIARDLREVGADSKNSVDSIVARAHAAEDEPTRPLWPGVPETPRDRFSAPLADSRNHRGGIRRAESRFARVVESRARAARPSPRDGRDASLRDTARRAADPPSSRMVRFCTSIRIVRSPSVTANPNASSCSLLARLISK